jgi:hypothetical protein
MNTHNNACLAAKVPALALASRVVKVGNCRVGTSTSSRHVI